jgi:anti-sigma factor RsiW
MDELTCKQVVELVTAYLEDALSMEDRRRFDEHLAGCPFCTIYLEQMRETIAALGHLPEASISADALSELRKAFRRM